MIRTHHSLRVAGTVLCNALASGCVFFSPPAGQDGPGVREWLEFRSTEEYLSTDVALELATAKYPLGTSMDVVLADVPSSLQIDMETRGDETTYFISEPVRGIPFVCTPGAFRVIFVTDAQNQVQAIETGITGGCL